MFYQRNELCIYSSQPRLYFTLNLKAFALNEFSRQVFPGLKSWFAVPQIRSESLQFMKLHTFIKCCTLQKRLFFLRICVSFYRHVYIEIIEMQGEEYEVLFSEKLNRMERVHAQNKSKYLCGRKTSELSPPADISSCFNHKLTSPWSVSQKARLRILSKCILI